MAGRQGKLVPTYVNTRRMPPPVPPRRSTVRTADQALLDAVLGHPTPPSDELDEPDKPEPPVDDPS